MTTDEIVLKSATALDHFESITDQPSDTDLIRLWEDVAPLLLLIPYDETGGKHNLIGIVRSKTAYLKRYGEAFPETKRVGEYNLEIDDNATTVVRARLEAAHKARCADRATFETARRETTLFVLTVVADTWVQELRDINTIYTKVDPQYFLCTCKQGAPAGTPSTSKRCTMRFSATIFRSRASPSILICSRTPISKPDGREPPSRMKPSFFLLARRC